MSDMEIAPDPIVRTALQRLPIPSHTDGFWARLAEQIDEGALPGADERKVLVAAPDGADPVADGNEPGPAPVAERDPALALVPPALRRTSNGVLLAVAAAAAVVVTLAGTALLEDRSGTEPLAPEDIAPSVASFDAQEEDPSATTVTLTDEGVDQSSDAVLAWVEDLGTGDGAAAWEALGDASKARFASQGEFEAEMATLAEDYGAWAEAEPDEVLVTPVMTDDEGTVAIVTLVGTVAQDGVSERRADAVPVRLVDGQAVVEPFVDAGTIELVVPEVGMDDEVSDAPVASDEPLIVVVPEGAAAPMLRLDDGETIVCGETEGTELTNLDEASGRRCSYLPPGGLAPGEHTLTTAFVGADGASISAQSTLFEAA